MTKKVRLVHIDGNTPIHIFAEIRDNGDLIFSAQEQGHTAKEMWGHVDYEYWLTIKAEYKDMVLLALIEKLYACDSLLVNEIKDYLESKGIPCEYYAYA